ncbi:MAG TPA: universal stress protein [Burkholderiales bacterium]|nr:universal stress protein [Burkholderiales bacterium]
MTANASAGTGEAGDGKRRRLLVPVDGSAPAEAAARYAARYAAQLGAADVLIAHVRPAGTPADVDPALRAAEAVHAAGVACTQTIEQGDAIQAILRLAARADEIVIGRTGTGQAKEMVAGSVTQKILLLASCPVTVVGADAAISAAGSRHRLLLAVDGSARAAAAVAYACRLAAAHPAVAIELVNVVGPIPPGFLWESMTPQRLERYYQEEGERTLAGARAALAAAGVAFGQRICSGYVIDRLRDAARTGGCSRLVMGSSGHGTASGAMLGSVAYRAIHAFPVPVTIVKPG